jgi:hypothetical protein
MHLTGNQSKELRRCPDTSGAIMNREKLLRRLTAYARKNKLTYVEDRESGKGSHYKVSLGERVTIVQKDLNPLRIKNILKQLGLRNEDI